jgi:hypothetical protein
MGVWTTQGAFHLMARPVSPEFLEKFRLPEWMFGQLKLVPFI